MIKNKKGFTLVEVLAVVIILGVISVIIYPILNNIFAENRRKAFEDSLNAVVRAAELYKADNMSKSIGIMDYTDENIKISDKEKWISGVITEEIDTSDSTEKIYLNNFSDGEFCGFGFEGKYTITKGECLETPDFCFEVSNNTVTGYNYESTACPNEIVIPEYYEGEELLYIADGAFYESPIQSIKISSNIKEIGDEAFKNSYLSSLDLSSATSLEYIGYEAFQDTFLGEVDFSNLTSLKYITPYAFSNSNLSGLVDLSNSKNLEYIEHYAFAYNDIMYLKINNLPNLVYICTYAFTNNNIQGKLDLTGLDKLESLDVGAFSNNYITTVDLSNLTLLYVINSGVFYSNNIKELKFLNNNSLLLIGTSTFGYNKISSIDYSEIKNIEVIADWAFIGNNINDFSTSYLPNLQIIGTGAFDLNNLPASQAYIYFVEPTKSEYINLAKNYYYLNYNGNKIVYDKNWLISYGGPKSTTSISIPEKTVGIDESIFGYLNLSSVDMSTNNSLLYINSWAFEHCSLNSLLLPNNLLYIGKEAFYSSNLTKITIPSTVTSIGSSAFYSNKEWSSVTIQSSSSAPSTRFNDNWTSIGWPASLKPTS